MSIRTDRISLKVCKHFKNINLCECDDGANNSNDGDFCINCARFKAGKYSEKCTICVGDSAKYLLSSDCESVYDRKHTRVFCNKCQKLLTKKECDSAINASKSTTPAPNNLDAIYFCHSRIRHEQEEPTSSKRKSQDDNEEDNGERKRGTKAKV